MSYPHPGCSVALPGAWSGFALEDSRSALTTGQRLRLHQATVWSSLAYALPYVGITAEVLRSVVSMLAGHLRKILRIYEEGVSNQQVMQRACLDPGDIFMTQLRRKVASISGDALRCPILKAPELMRSKELEGALSEVLAQQHISTSVPTGPSLVPILESAQLACPECGVYYATKEGLQMHIQHRHPHLNAQACFSFRRDVHSLFGLPICRFCKARLYDWKSLTRHITTGTCLRIKEFLAAGLSESAMLQRLEVEESASPPVPPAGAQGGAELRAQIEAALSLSNQQLVAGGAELLILARHCALCQQIIKEAGKVKNHWSSTHVTEYRKVKAVVESEAKSLVSVFSRPCRFCGGQARSERDHSGKCASLFQLLAVRHLRSCGALTPAPSCGPSLKQSSSPPQYQLFSKVDTPLGRAFGLRKGTASASPKAEARSSNGSTTAATAVSAAAPLPSGLQFGEAPRLAGPWLTTLQPRNIIKMSAS